MLVFIADFNNSLSEISRQEIKVYGGTIVITYDLLVCREMQN